MTDYKYEVQDLISAAYEQRPTDFEAAFNDLIVDRLRDAVEAKKIEVAQQMYNYEPPEPEPENDDEFGAADLEEPEETSSEEE
jgi:hypothetical protein